MVDATLLKHSLFVSAEFEANGNGHVSGCLVDKVVRQHNYESRKLPSTFPDGGQSTSSET